MCQQVHPSGHRQRFRGQKPALVDGRQGAPGVAGADPEEPRPRIPLQPGLFRPEFPDGLGGREPGRRVPSRQEGQFLVVPPRLEPHPASPLRQRHGLGGTHDPQQASLVDQAFLHKVRNKFITQSDFDEVY